SQGRTTIKKNVLLSVCVHHSLWEGGADFHAWVERKFFSWMFYLFENEHRRRGRLLKRPFAKPLQGIHAHFTSCLCNEKAIPPNQKKKPQTVMDASRLGFAQE
ncbi:hypothetical protein, partial [Geobacillus sp. Geo 8.1]